MADLNVESAEQLLRDKDNSYTKGPGRNSSFRAVSKKVWRQTWGRAKALLAKNGRLASLGRFPPGAGEVSAAHRKRVPGKK